MDNKITLRGSMKAFRHSLSDEEMITRSMSIQQRVIEQLKTAQYVACYWPIDHEVRMDKVLAYSFRQGKTVCLPVWNTTKAIYQLGIYHAEDHIASIPPHPPQPSHPSHLDPLLIEVVICPGLAFDKLGHRLGFGGGYYDRLLAELNASTKKIGIAFAEQLVDKIATEQHDIPMDVVITDKEILTIR